MALLAADWARPRLSTLTWACIQCGREFRTVALPTVEMPECCSLACAEQAEGREP